jgi:predicted RNA binding protein YcfA (HicA-like mRNA interferase family)
VYNIIAEESCTVKHRDFIQLLARNGWWFKRNGGNHDIYTNGTDCEPVSRQTAIPDTLVAKIKKRRGLK